MFNQRKSILRNRWFLLTMILLVGAGYWINGSADPFDENVPSEQSTETNQPIGDDPNTNNRSTNSDNNQEPNIINEQAPYYLMKEENGTISIYYCGDTGEETFIRHADIDYSSLSQGDQTLFLKGITAKTEEELQELLQDFGS